MIDYSKRTFAFYIEAKEPVATLQLMFSEEPDCDKAAKEVLAEFDRDFPKAVDRRIFRVMEYAAYQKEVDRADELNRYMSM